MKFSRAAMVLAVVAAPACAETDLTAPGGARHIAEGAPPAVTTDAASYRLEPEWVGVGTWIDVTFTNRSAERMYISNCQGSLTPELQKRVDGDWVSWWTPVMLLCLSQPMVVAPGASLTRPVRVWAALPGLHNAFPVWPSADVAGTYRLVLHGIHWKAGNRADAAPVPLAGRVSAEFTFDL